MYGKTPCLDYIALRFCLFGKMKPNRRSVRLPGYDYASAGWYFVTIICHKRQHLFGNVVRANCIRPEGPELVLNQLGMIVRQEWVKSAQMRPDVELGEFVIMPNHFWPHYRF